MKPPLAKLIFGIVAATCLSAVTGCGDARRIDHSIPSLLKTLQEDKDPNMRYWAADSLGKFGPDAQAAVPALVAVLKDENKMVRMGAAYALGEIGSTEAISSLREAGKDSEKEVRLAANTALKRIQQKSKKR